MEAAHLLAFNVVLAAVILTPGPARVARLHATLIEGRVAGFATGAGLALVAAGWTGLALLGLDRIFILVPWAHIGLKGAGASYLVWLGVRTIADATAPLPAPRVPRHGVCGALLRGAAINLANPKSILFAASALIVVFQPDLSPHAMALVMADHLAVELAFYAALATRPSARAAYLRAKATFDRVTGAAMVALGLRLLMAPR